MSEKDKWVDAVTKLIQLTQEGKLRWEAKPPSDPLKVKPDDKIEAVFVARHKGKALRLYRRLHKEVYRSTPLETILPNVYGRRSPGEEYWTSTIVLEFFDPVEGISLWSFPRVNVLDDLVSTVRYQVAGVKDFLNDLLEGAA